MAKINYLYKTILLIALAALFTACPHIAFQDLKIINNSDKGILWGLTQSNVSDMKYNPWITNSSGKVVSTMEDVKNSIAYIEPGDTYIYSIRLDGYEKYSEFV